MSFFNWSEFLELARNLAGQTCTGYSTEAKERTSVSRAYYAAYCFARNYAETNQSFKRKQTPEDHRLLREHFKSLGGGWSEVAEGLEDLRKWLNRCDYEDRVLNLNLLVSGAISTAEKVISSCK